MAKPPVRGTPSNRWALYAAMGVLLLAVLVLHKPFSPSPSAPPKQRSSGAATPTSDADASDTPARLLANPFSASNKPLGEKRVLELLAGLLARHQELNASECQDRRLLVMNWESTLSFEGFGSAVSHFVSSLAQAVHANRTLIVGPRFSLPKIFHGRYAECPTNAMLCFFRPISTCTWDDVSEAERAQLVARPFDDAARVAISEPRRAALALWIPPRLGQLRSYPRINELWSAACAAYVTRLSDVMKATMNSALTETLGSLARPRLGVHIRHGDLLLKQANGQALYGNRAPLPFSVYADVIRQFAGDVSSVLVASDSTEVDAFLGSMRTAYKGLTFGTTEAFRTRDGSHTVASLQSLPPNLINKYAKEVTDAKERAGLVFRVNFEAQRDVLLLSYCDELVGSATSFFTVLAQLLRRARGIASPPTYLDEDSVATGAHSLAMYHGSVNRSGVLANPVARWQALLQRFASIPLGRNDQPLVFYDKRSHILNVSEAFFDSEARFWTGLEMDTRGLRCASGSESAADTSVEKCAQSMLMAGHVMLEHWAYDKATTFAQAGSALVREHKLDALRNEMEALEAQIKKAVAKRIANIVEPAPTMRDLESEFRRLGEEQEAAKAARAAEAAV